MEDEYNPYRIKEAELLSTLRTQESNQQAMRRTLAEIADKERQLADLLQANEDELVRAS